MSEAARQDPATALPDWPPVAPEGALAPRFKLPDHGGQSWGLGNDAIAGRPIVLIFAAGFEQPADRDHLLAFRALAEPFAACQATLIGITRQTTASNAERRLELDLPLRLLSDLLGEVNRVYRPLLADPAVAGGAPFAVVLSPALRIARLIGPGAGDQAAAALEEAQSIMAPRKAERVPLHPPVLQIPGALSPAECRYLIDLHGRPETPWIEPGDPEDRFDYKLRVGDHRRADRIDYVVNDPKINRRLDDKLSQRIAPEIEKAYQYKVNRREPYHIAHYEGRRGGFSIGHRDNPTPDLAHRRFALSINLNQGEFEGGELVFREFGEQRYQVPTGTALIFSSSLLHEVLAVTAGRRFVLLSHLFGDAGV
ncbi:MAG: 2OG-Fe(II) oxygenase [Pseudomonadota bacterium]